MLKIGDLVKKPKVHTRIGLVIAYQGKKWNDLEGRHTMVLTVVWSGRGECWEWESRIEKANV